MNFRKTPAFFSLILFFYITKTGSAIRTKDKMYENIEASKACFRRLNATHQIGCTSKRGGSTGVLHYCRTQADLDFILKNGSAPPYIPVIPTKLFNVDNLNKLKQSSRISGLLLYAVRLSHFSHENKCPNPQSSLPDTCTDAGWNPYGTGLLYQDIPFPVFYVEDEEYLTFARQCFEKHNNYSFSTQRDRSLCSLELNSFMYAATNSSTCIRRSNMITNLNPVKFCDPLGDQNAWASLFPMVKPSNFSEPLNDCKYIVLAARLDTTSMFEKTAGAISPITGLVTLLSTAKFLKEILPSYQNYKKNVLFVVFNGESYDYIGSQRFVYELMKGNFPTKSKQFLPNITIDDIDLIIELSQMNKTGVVAAHYLSNAKSKEFIAKLKNNSGVLKIDELWDSLPPGSVHTFIKKRKDIPSLIISDHKSSYLNPFYNSVYDNATNLNFKYMNLSADSIVEDDNIQSHIKDVATMVAKSIYTEITSAHFENEKKSEADLQFIDELLHCYLENADCRVHQAIQKMKFTQQPLSLYVGVEVAPQLLTPLVGLTLGWITGDEVGPGNEKCTNEPRNYAFRYYNMSRSLDDLNVTMCYRITMNFTEAVSPAFKIDGYDWYSGEYSTWTESTWGDIKLRVFLKPSAAHENMTIALGSIVFIFSLIFVYFVKSKSHILFAPQLPTLAPTSC